MLFSTSDLPKIEFSLCWRNAPNQLRFFIDFGPFWHPFCSPFGSVLVPFGPQVPPAASKGTSRAPPGAPLGSQKSTQTLPRSPQRAKRCLQRASGTPLGSIFKPPALRLGCTVYVRPSVQMLQCTEPTRSSAFEVPCFNPGPAECAERLNKTVHQLKVDTTKA